MARRDEVWESRAGGYIEPINPLGFDILVKGLNKYINFRDITGSAGYGFRDNNGVMQIKNSGGSWVNIPTSSSGSGDVNWGGNTNTATKYIGSLDNQDVGFITNNQLRLLISKTGAIDLNNNTIVNVANIGIGLTNPTYPLQIKYNAGNNQLALNRSDGNPIGFLGVNSSNKLTLMSSSGSGDVSISQNIGGSGQVETLFIKGATGNVGIGTTNPSVKLDVLGAIYARVSSNSAWGIAALNNDTGKIIGGFYRNSSGNGNAYLYTSDGTPKVLFSSQGNSYFMGGNIGIGTTNPGRTLDVVGEIRSYDANGSISLMSGTYPTLRAYDSASNLKSQWINAPSIGATYFDYSGADGGFLRIRNTLNSDTGTVFTINSTGNVGIGTTTPTLARLQIEAGNGVVGQYINGGTTVGTDLLKLRANAATQRLILEGAGGTVQTFLEAGGSIGLFGTATNHDFRIRTNYVDRMTFDTNGNVGIGTTSPDSNLHVVGSARITSTFNMGGTNYATNISTYSNGGTFTLQNRGAVNIGISGYNTIINSDNVGIGTTTPSSPSSITRILNIASAGGNAGLTLTSGAQNYELANVSGSLWFIDDNSVKMVIQNSTGNIGIGTNNPSSRFHITGSVSQRNLQISDTGLITQNYFDTSGNTPFLTMYQNYGNAAVTADINWKAGVGGTGTHDAARIRIGYEQDWQTSASTRNSYMSLFTSLNGVLSEKVRVNSLGSVGVGLTNITSKLDIAGSDATLPSFRIRQGAIDIASATPLQGAFVNNGNDIYVGLTNEYSGNTEWSKISKQPSSYGVVGALPSITDNGNGTITIESQLLSVLLGPDTNASVAPQLYFIDTQAVMGAVTTLTDGTFNYIVANFNGADPIIEVITDVTLIDEATIVPIYSIYRNGNYLHTQPWGQTSIQGNWGGLGGTLANKIHQSIVKTQRYRREFGLSISEYGTRNVRVTAGKIYQGAVPINLDEVASATDNIFFYYHNAGNWTSSVVTQYNNTQYDNGTNLVTLTSNRYAVNFVYRGIENQKHLYIVLGTGDYTLAQAQSAQPPAIPAVISSHATLVGKIIVQNGSATAYSVQSAFDVQFSASGVTSHPDLTNLNADNNFLHVTSTEKATWNAKQDALTKATGSDINTGTDDAKYVTPKAIADSNISFPSKTETLTNKRITPRVLAITSSATPTINTDNCDAVTITAQAEAITSMTTNLSGTPTNFQKLMIRIKDNGTARAITWGASFEAKGVALPTTTTAGKVSTIGFVYDTVTSKWGCVAVATEA